MINVTKMLKNHAEFLKSFGVWLYNKSVRNKHLKILNLTFVPCDPGWPEVEAGVKSPVALLLVQPPEGVFGQAVLHKQVQVAVPFDQDANDATLWTDKIFLGIWNLKKENNCIEIKKI